MDNLLGIDIGGTKCAVTYGIKTGDNLTVVDKEKFPTTEVNETIAHICAATKAMMQKHGLTPQNTSAIGISCGGPLDSRKGVVMSPPNLPGWDNIPITAIIEKETGIKCGLQNDANACALAEWKFGAGRGTQNMVFLTFGTGLGAGIIANGQIYTGANDNAGEAGHIRLAEFGPVGYGKAGSFEGFASGSGIAQLARMRLSEVYQMGGKVAWCDYGQIDTITAKDVTEAAAAGDPLALEIVQLSARYLGIGLSVLIDILNPELIVIGGVFARRESLFRPQMEETIRREALPLASRVCRVVPAQLGEAIGDYAALSVVNS
jgi:glucokinase